MQKLATHLPAIAAAFATLAISGTASAQAFGPGGQRPQPEIENLPRMPTAVALPTLSAEVKGPGAMFDSAPSQAEGLGLDHFKYRTLEYFVTGTADGQPYTTRVVVRRPSDDRKFSGLVLAESMHSSGAAHAFEYTSVYTMNSGHAAVEILTTSPAQFTAFNAARYEKLQIADGQADDILAQVGALVKSPRGPLGSLAVRKMVLGGTSMSSGHV